MPKLQFSHYMIFLTMALAYAAFLQWAGQTALDKDELHSAIGGRMGSWVVDRHPPFVGFVGYAWAELTGYSTVAFFAFSKLNALLAIGVIYLLSREFLPRHLALLATAAYGASFPFISMSQTIDQNSILHAVWPAAVWLTWRALKDERLLYWIGAGVLVGVSMLAKYHSVLLAFCLLVAVIAVSFARKTWPWRACLLAMVIAIGVVLPHIIAEIGYGYPTIAWSSASAGGATFTDGGVGRASIPSFVAANALFNAFGLGVLMFLAWRRKYPILRATQDQDEAVKLRFLLALGVLFPALPVILSLIMGITLKPTWGFNAFFLTPTLFIWLIYRQLPNPFGDVTWRRFAVLLPIYLILMTSVVVANAFRDVGRPYATTDLVSEIDQYWQNNTDAPLELVIANSEHAFATVFYSDFKPKMAPNRGLFASLQWVLDENSCFQGPTAVVSDAEDHWFVPQLDRATPASFAGPVQAAGRWTNLTYTKDVRVYVRGYPDGICFNRDD